MSMSCQHPAYQGPHLERNRMDEHPVTPEPAAVYRPDLRHSRRACCCPARPAVIAVMPAANGRQWSAELLLCGHHYRQSRQALAANGARLLDVMGYPLGSQTWPEPAC